MVAKTREFFVTHDVSSAYVLLARDWHQAREKEIRNAFTITYEPVYPGVKLLRIRVAHPGRNEGSLER